jgi:hypothetical protein
MSTAKHTSKTRDVKAIFGDSSEIAGVLRGWAYADGVPTELNYWLMEAADHITGLYADACDMQRRIKRLEAKLAALTQQP